MSPRRAAVLRGAGDGQSLREHLIATAERLISGRGTAALPPDTGDVVAVILDDIRARREGETR